MPPSTAAGSQPRRPECRRCCEAPTNPNQRQTAAFEQPGAAWFMPALTNITRQPWPVARTDGALWSLHHHFAPRVAGWGDDCHVMVVAGGHQACTARQIPAPPARSGELLIDAVNKTSDRAGSAPIVAFSARPPPPGAQRNHAPPKRTGRGESRDGAERSRAIPTRSVGKRQRPKPGARLDTEI